MPHMPATASGIRLAVGVSESGKTHGICRDLDAAAQTFPIVVLDGQKELTHAGVPSRAAPSVKRAIEMVRERVRFVIVRPPRGERTTAAAELLEWALSLSGDRSGQGQTTALIGIAIPEAQNLFPNNRDLSEDALELVTAWRHHRIAAWFDTQRFALINTTIAAQAREVRLYTMHSDVDIARAKSLVRKGDELVLALDECAARFDRAEYGWHVTLANSRRPPYIPER